MDLSEKVPEKRSTLNFSLTFLGICLEAFPPLGEDPLRGFFGRLLVKFFGLSIRRTRFGLLGLKDPFGLEAAVAAGDTKLVFRGGAVRDRPDDL